MPRYPRAGSVGAAPLAPALFALLLGCTAASDPWEHLGDPPSGATRGELSAFIATGDDGTMKAQYFLRVARTDRDLELVFDVDPELPSGKKLDVWGGLDGERLRVDRYSVLPEDPVVALHQAVIDGPPYKPRSFAFSIVRIADPPANPLSMDVAKQRLIGTMPSTQPSVRQYYMEASYGRQDIAGDVFGPFSFPMPTGCMTSQLATALRGMIPGTYNHYLWYLEPRTPNCQWSGLASTGTPERPSRDTWYNGSAGCVVLMQEPGHNFGMQHSSSMKCGPMPFADDPMTACTHNEYGDRYDPMGSGCRHMNAFQKAYQGWFDKCNVVEVGSDGTFTLVPLELPCDGVQVLQVPMPKVRMFPHSGGGGRPAIAELSHYFIELRSPIGIDKGLTPMVQIRVSSDIRSRSDRGDHSWFLDMNPTTTTLDGLAPGASFTDPTGSPKITVVSADAMKAQVTIEFMGGSAGAGMPAAACLDGMPLQGMGPGPESCVAAPAAPSGTPPVIPDGGTTGGGSGGGSRDGGRSDSGSSRADARTAEPDAEVNVSEPDAATKEDARPAVGGSVGGSGGGSKGEAGSGEGGGGGSDEPHGSAVKGGCNCTLGTGGSPRGASLLLLIAIALRRRRRR